MRKPSRRQPTSPTRPAFPSVRRPRPLVMVVDDEPDVCDAIAMTLKSMGFRAAASGHQLHLSRRTIEMHKLRAMRRLGVGASTEMTRLIVEARAAGILAER